MKLKQLLLVVAISAASAVGSVWIYGKLTTTDQASFISPSKDAKMPANYAGFFDNVATTKAGDPVDFSKAANAAVPAVVHIKTKIPARRISNQLPTDRDDDMDGWFRRFFDFGPQIQPEQRASGSGVIISDDGYIVTNNHVISDGNNGVAEEITVTLNENKKTFKAKVIGRDPSSDLAVLKIDGNRLPYILYGNSDEATLGQWVLAVGYPLTLEATVTAGIISAKGRSIGINRRQSDSPIESFIQTDAAVNQGNSGGALITTDGKLIGINSAILAPSGTYAGYSFAIPVNIVKKVVNDLIEFGEIKRGYLGITYQPVESENARLIRQTGAKDAQGVYVQSAPTDGAAYKAGLRAGDVITKIAGKPVSNGMELSANIAGFRPGEKVPVTYLRNGKENTVNVTLNATASKIDIADIQIIGDRLGVDLEELSKEKAAKYNLDGGVIVKKIKDGGPLSRTRMEAGFIITNINGRDIKNSEELGRNLNTRNGKLRLEGIYPGYNGVYTYEINLNDEDF
jgi:serine protease Do